MRYRAWDSMLQRCYNRRHRAWKNYGGRSIRVCERWLIFENFAADMGPHPGKGWSLDRYPDNDGNYELNNCRWATKSMQRRNQRNNKLTQVQADEIKTRRLNGESQNALATEFSVSRNMIWLIVRERIWA